MNFLDTIFWNLCLICVIFMTSSMFAPIIKCHNDQFDLHKVKRDWNDTVVILDNEKFWSTY